MASSAKPPKGVILQPNVAIHVSRRERRGRDSSPNLPGGRDVGHLLKPVLIILIVLCALAGLLLLAVNWRLAAVESGRGSLDRVDGARDVFDDWIRPMIYVVGSAAAVLLATWMSHHPIRRRPSPRKGLVLAGIIGFAIATLIGAVIGGETVSAARGSNLAAIASFLFLAGSALVMLTELSVEPAAVSGSARPIPDHHYLPEL
jgi:MFS family permease